MVSAFPTSLPDEVEILRRGTELLGFGFCLPFSEFLRKIMAKETRFRSL